MRTSWSAGQLSQCRNLKLRSWLSERGSLSARCSRLCQCFRVRLLSYRCRGAGGKLWEREVVLECDGLPVIFARSEFFVRRGGCLLRRLSGLGNRSLASILFSLPRFVRSKREYCRLDQRDSLFLLAVQAGQLHNCQTLWARRTLHRLGAESILVTEIFLPTLLSVS